MTTITRNLEKVRQRIAAACARAGRPSDAVRLVAVTKTATIEQVQSLYDLGLRDFAENRLENAQPRIAQLPGDICWHWIAPIQRRKARDIAALFHHIDAIDRLEAAEALDKRCAELGRVLPVLIEVNVSGETSKHGFTPQQLAETLPRLIPLQHLQVRGLMTMAPLGASESELRDIFRGLRQLADAHNFPERSMGMSDDFETAIEEGATQVRIGSLLFH